VRDLKFVWVVVFALLSLSLGTAYANAPTSKTPATKPAPQKPAAQKPTAKPKSEATSKSDTEPAPEASKSRSKPRAKGKSKGDAPAAPAKSGSSDKAAARKSSVYGDRLDGLQAEVNELQDKIFRSKAHLSLLKETVLRGVLAGSRVILAHRNLMGSSFRLVRIVFILDGAQIYARTDETGTLDQEDELVIYDGNLPPGAHNVTIELTYKGHGYGVFSYLSGYTFESRSSHSFTAPENGAIKLLSVGFERGNITTEMRDRPSVDWQEILLDASGRPLPQPRGRGRTKASRPRRK
jgi:hypothetical protein